MVWDARGVPGAAPCPSDPLNGYFASSCDWVMDKGSLRRIPGFDLPGGGVEDWRQGAYIADTWKVTPSFTLTAGLRWSVDTGRANQDLAPPLCSDVTVVPSPCSGNTPLFDQLSPGLGRRCISHTRTSGRSLVLRSAPEITRRCIRAAFGIFYESNPFNNTTNLRGPMIKTGLFNDANHTICGGTNSLVLPDGTTITSDGGVPFSTICSQPISQAGAALYQHSKPVSGGNEGRGAGEQRKLHRQYADDDRQLMAHRSERRIQSSGMAAFSASSSRAESCRSIMFITRR